MGKNKSQRTKNNAKPSNSSRSAEFLGATIPNFVGFPTDNNESFVSILPGLSSNYLNDNEMNKINPNFQVTIKKMNKKDPTTKVKALHEFATLCQDSPLSSVETVVPIWPRIYCQLAVDTEHKVREAAQYAHAALVKKVKKGIAGCLKQLAGCWFTSQFDTYPPAALTAKNSFRETFSGNKYVEAIVHCQDEILMYIYDTIKSQTINNNKPVKDNAEDVAESNSRINLICSLYGYSCYLKNIPSNKIKNSIHIQEQIVDSSKFWDIVKYKNPQIKVAFFNVLLLIIEKMTDLLKNKKKQVMIIIINNLDETESRSISAVWECMLVAINKIDDWYSVVNLEKFLLPKLWHILKDGGRGCVNIIYPFLLPLFNELLKFDLDGKILFTNFFNNIRSGFDNVKTLRKNRSEMTSMLTSFIECLQYTIILYNNDINYCKMLVRTQLMQLIESLIIDYSSTNIILFDEVSKLIRCWSYHRKENEAQYCYELTRLFWDELESIFNKNKISTMESSSKLTNIYEAEIKLLLSLQKFSDISQTSTDNNLKDNLNLCVQRCHINNIVAKHQESIPAMVPELESFVNKICIAHFNDIENTTDDNLNIVTRILADITSHFDSGEPFKAIANEYKYNNLLDLYTKKLKPLLFQQNTQTQNFLLSIIFNLIKYICDDEKDTILNSFEELDNNEILHSALNHGLMDSNINDKSIEKWRKNKYITAFVRNTIRKYTNNRMEDGDKFLILKCLKKDNSKARIDEDAITDIINVVCDTLINSNNMSKTMISFSYELLTLLCHNQDSTNVFNILKILFQLSISENVESTLKSYLRDKFESESNIIFGTFSKEEILNIQRDYIQMVYKIIFSSNNINNDIINVLQIFFKFSNCNNCYDAITNLIDLNSAEKLLTKDGILQFKSLVLRGEFLTGKLHLLNPSKSLTSEESLKDLMISSSENFSALEAENCLKWSLVNVMLFNDLLGEIHRNNSSIEILQEFLIKSLSGIFYIINDTLILISLSKLYCDHYKCASNYSSVGQINSELLVQYNKLKTLFISMNIWDPMTGNKFINLDNYWIEYGSIFAQYLYYFCGNSLDLSEQIKLGREELVKKYMETDKKSLTILDQIHGILLARSLLEDDENNDTENNLSIQILSIIMENMNDDHSLLIRKEEMNSVSYSQMYLLLEYIRLFSKLINKNPIVNSSSNRNWDPIFEIYLPSWVDFVDTCKFQYNDFRVQLSTVVVSQLFSAVNNVVNNNQNETNTEFPSELINKYRDVYAPEVNRQIINIWIYYGDTFCKKGVDLSLTLMLNYFCEAVKIIDSSAFFETSNRATKITITEDQLMNFSLKLLSSSMTCFHLSAYYTLNSMIPVLVKRDESFREEDSADNIEKTNINCFLKTLSCIEEEINMMFKEFKLCDTRNSILICVDTYNCILGYFLVWSNILKIYVYASADMRYQYAEILKNDYCSNLMNNIFRTMPADIFKEANIRTSIPRFAALFKALPALNVHDDLSISKINQISCYLYVECLRHLPVLVRNWWSTVEGKVSNIVEKITTLYASPILCEEELSDRKLSTFDNMQVKIHPVSREVIAIYQMDDTKLELCITLPINYPLESVIIKTGQYMGSTTNWKYCDMQLSIFLNYQNGSIWDGLMMWKKNLDKKFSGVEECYICFSILHVNTFQIPKLSCHTCRKKFHASCLYKWFSTSQKSTCPICRNLF